MASVLRHKCPVEGCPTLVDQDKLMCWVHWGRVPMQLRRAVWGAWHNGQPAPDHAVICDVAIAAVNEKLHAERQRALERALDHAREAAEKEARP